MAAVIEASSDTFCGAIVPKVCNVRQRSYFGDIALATFLLMQCL